MRHLVIDLETNSKNVHKRAGNSWYNKIVAIGYKFNNVPFVQSKYNVEDYNLILRELLPDVDIIVGHNIKFDLLHLWKQESLQNWLKAGGKIWDTQYAHYTLYSQQDKYPALRDIAVNYYGCRERPKYIEDLLFNKVEPNDYQDICDLPRDLVLKDVESDVLDTESIYLQQVEKAKQLKMYDLLVWSMDSILATTEMEYNGMMRDKEIFDRNKKRLEEELQEEYNKLDTIVQKYWI